MSDLFIRTEADLAALASLEGWQADEKFRARIEAKGRKLEREIRQRALPSGPAPSWFGLAVALFALSVSAFVVALGVIGWGLVFLFRRIVKR